MEQEKKQSRRKDKEGEEAVDRKTERGRMEMKKMKREWNGNR